MEVTASTAGIPATAAGAARMAGAAVRTTMRHIRPATQSSANSSTRGFDGFERQRAVLAVLAARRSVLAREMTRLEVGIEPDPPVLGHITALQTQFASLQTRLAELDRAVAGLARIRGDSPRADGHSTDGDPIAAA